MLLGMNIFTSFFVLLLLLSKNVPSATDKIPLIGAYYCLNMLMIATSTIACTIVVHIFFRGQGKVPFLLRKIFLEFLGRLLCMALPTPLPPLPPQQTMAYSSIVNTLDKNVRNRSNRPTNNQLLTSVSYNQQQTATLLQNGQLHNQTHHLSLSLPRNTTGIQLKDQLSSGSCASLDLNEELNRQLETAQQNEEFMRQRFSLNSPTHRQKQLQQLQQQLQQQQQQAQQQHQNQQQQQQHTHTHLQSNQLNTELNLSFNLIENDIKEIRDYLRHTRKKLENNDLKTRQTNEWKQVALILDRTLFYVYIILMFISVTLVMHT